MMKFTETHEWVDVENGIGVVGVSKYAQKELGDIVYVELPKMNKEVKAGQEAAVLESTKAAADVYSPVSGTIIEINNDLLSSPEMINQAPETKGWLFKVKLNSSQELDKLMDKDAYEKKFS